jgi:PAS domain-containing protein
MTATDPSPSAPQELGPTLAGLGRRIGAVRSGAVPSGAAVRELETAYEELRVAGEELRSQQEQIDALLAEHDRPEARQARIAGELPVAVLATDAGGGIRFANLVAAALLDVPVHRLSGKPLLAYIAAGSRSDIRSALRDLARDGAPQHRTIILTGRAGVAHEVDAYGAREPNADGAGVSWVFVPAREQSERLPQALLELTRLATSGDCPEELLRGAVRVCGSALGEEVATTLMLGVPAAPEATASTSGLAQAVDGAQLITDQGPCAAAIATAATVVSQSLPDDRRWPALAGRLAGLDVGGAVATPLLVEDVAVGSLGAYLPAGRAPSATTAHACRLLGAAVSSLLHEVRLRRELVSTAQGLRTALASRATIEQAKGIVMADRRCTPDEAFQVLVDLSSRRNTKLRAVAAAIVERAARPAPDRPKPR